LLGWSAPKTALPPHLCSTFPAGGRPIDAECQASIAQDKESFMNKRVVVALIAFVVWTAITVIGGNIKSGGEGALLDAVTKGIGWPFVLAAGFLLAVVAWKGWRDVGLNAPTSSRSLLLAWLPMIYIVAGLGFSVSFGLPPAGVVMLILINTLFVGLSEELMFRGVLLQAFRSALSIWPAVILTSVAFGAIHSMNVFITGNLVDALVQSTAAFVSGLIFIALRLRTGSLWPSIIVHALWDFATFTMIASQAPDAPSVIDGDGPTILLRLFPILVVLPNGLYGLWLMRNIGATHGNPTS
jgi:membrane protease YdiL (CAAX protease family)